MKPKLLLILPLPPPMHGAAAVGNYIINSTLILNSFECHVINLSTSRHMGEIGKMSIKKIFIYLSIIFSVTLKLMTNHFDLCYIAIMSKGSGFIKDFLIVCLTKLFGKKIVYHLHSRGVSDRQGKWLDHLLYKKVFNKSSIILLSKYLYSDIQKYVSLDQVYICHNGIPSMESASDVSCSHGNDPVEILFLSNLMEAKGIFVLLDACRLLKEKGYVFTCKFVGAPSDISQKRFAAEVSEKGLADCVFYMGAKYGKEKELYFRNADVFAFPSFSECFPLVLLEAMQFSLPVVSTYVGGIPDIVEHERSGYLCPPRDAIALAEKLGLLISDRALREQMGAVGYRKYKENFTLEIFENRMNDILLSICSDENRMWNCRGSSECV